jgi:uncharacterized lipoprotein YmbA
MKTDSIYTWGIVAILITLNTGCASPSQPTRFYRLDGNLEQEEMIDLMPRPGVIQIGVAPVVLASYLDRPQIVERQSDYRLELYEFEQWAGSLQDNLLSLVSRQLQQQLGKGKMQVIAYPWQAMIRPAYELQLSVSRFDRSQEEITLQARWSLIQSHTKQIVVMQQMSLIEPLPGGDIEDGIAAANQVVGRLSAHMASQIRLHVHDRDAD